MKTKLKNKKKHYLITGGLGFIGSAITNRLLKNGYKVSVLDDLSRGKKRRIVKKSKNLIIINGDIRKIETVKKALSNIDAVIHLAYINGTKYFYTKPTDILEIAVKGIVNIIDGCKSKNIKELYLASSSEVYQTPNKIPTTEKESLKIPDVYNPRYSYGGGKILTELMGIHYGKKFFKRMIIFRPHNVYGKDMGNEHVVPEFINRFKKLKREKFKIQGSGLEIRSFIHINDFISAFELIVKKGKHLNIYNIGTSEKVRIKELAYKIAKIFNKKIILKKSKLQKGGTKIRLPDISKIRKLGFKPKFNLNKGLTEVIN